MIANYPIRIGVLEQGSQSPIPPTISDGTGLFLDIRLGNGHYVGVDNGRMFTLPLNPNNAYGVIDWGDGSPIEGVPAGSTGVQHEYPASGPLGGFWSGVLQTEWLLPDFNASGVVDSPYGLFYRSAGAVFGFTGKGVYAGTNIADGAFANGYYSSPGGRINMGEMDLHNITGLRSLNWTFGNLFDT